MYLALQEMNVRTADGSVATLQIGDPIAGFEGWPQWTQKAMIEAAQVRWAPEGLAPHEMPQNVRKVTQKVPPGPLPRPEKEAAARRPEPAASTWSPGAQAIAAVPPEGPAAVDSQAPEKLLVRKVIKPKEEESIRKPVRGGMQVDPSVQVTHDVPQKGALDCPNCERQGFKDFNGLRIHIAKAHKE